MVKMKCMVMHECVKGQNYVANDWLTSMYKIYVYYLHYDLHIVHNYKCETLRGMYWKLIWWTHTPIECLCVEVSFPPSLILSSPAGMVLLLWKGIWSEVPSSFICLGRSSSLPSSFCFWKVHSVNRKLLRLHLIAERDKTGILMLILPAWRWVCFLAKMQIHPA